MEQIQAEIEKPPGYWFAVNQQMFFDEVPAARPNEQYRDLIFQPIGFAFRALKFDCSPNRVAQIDVAIDHVVPSRSVGVFEIRHEYLRAGVQGVDHHFAIGRSCDLNAAIGNVFRDGRNFPIIGADLCGLRQKVGSLTVVKIRLPTIAPLQ